MRTAQACLLAAGLLALAAPAANAGGWGGRYGVVRESSQESASAWSVRESSQESSWGERGDRGSCPMVDRREDFRRDLRCAGPADIRLGSIFFEGTGGVGPFPDFETSGGGGFILAGGEGSAFASASASARVFVRFSGHGHGHGGGHTGGCGCKK